METVERDYSAKGVKFYYIYKALAHPETNGYVAPFTLDERLMHVAEAKKKIGSRINWLCDTMENDAKHALGDAPNSEFIIGPDGKFIEVRRWSSPSDLRNDLAELVGKVENPTSIADVGMKPVQAPKTAPKGIVPRLKLPSGMTPVKVAASAGLSSLSLPLAGALPGNNLSVGDPLYVKLRAEVDSEYLRNGKGKLYLGFFLDPLYEVHWNNQVAPVAYEIEAPSGIDITPTKGDGPMVDEKADADPREFLVELSGESDDPIKLTVKYFACDDAETFCKPVTQHYLVTLERDRDGGSRRSQRGGGRPSGGALAGRPGSGPPSPTHSRLSDEDATMRSTSLKSAVAIFRKHDKDENGKLNESELIDAKNIPADTDANEDGIVSFRELVDAIKANAAPSTSNQRDRSTARPGGVNSRSRPNPAEMLARMDANDDGKISKSEVPQQMLLRWSRMDTNEDGVIDKKELQALAERFKRFSRDR